MKTTRIMNKIIIYLSAVLLLCSCGSARHYKVTDSGERKEVAGSGGEHWYWESDDWYYIDRNGDIVGTLMQDSTRFGRSK